MRLLPPEFTECTKEDYVSAASELAVVLVFSLMPVWLGLVLAAASTRAGAFTGFAVRFASTGDALLVSAALIGPLMYVITRRYGELPEKLTIHFPYGWVFVSLISVICVIAAGFFGYAKVFLSAAQPEGAGFQEPIDPGFVSMLSIVVLVLSVALLFLVSSLRNYLDRVNPAQSMRADLTAFMEKWERK